MIPPPDITDLMAEIGILEEKANAWDFLDANVQAFASLMRRTLLGNRSMTPDEALLKAVEHVGAMQKLLVELRELDGREPKTSPLRDKFAMEAAIAANFIMLVVKHEGAL